MRQLLWAQGWSRYGSSARCPRNRRGWLRLHQAPAHRCVHTAGARCHGLDRPIRPDQGRSPARSPFPVRSEPLPASGSAGYAAYPLPGVRPPGSCRLAGAVRRCAAPGPGPGRSRSGTDPQCPADRQSLALRLPAAGGRSRRRGRAHSRSPTHSLPGWSPHARIRRHSV